MGTHDGHRQRLREQFLRSGGESLNDFQLLELLLFYAIPRSDTNELAHALLERFGSLPALIEASVEEITTVKGIGENAAILLRLLPAVHKRYIEEKAPKNCAVDTTEKAANYFIPIFLYEPDEIVCVLYLDARYHPIACEELSRGVVNSVSINPRLLAQEALRYRASSVIIAHNHPSGTVVPSIEDTLTTQQLTRALDLLGIELRDHIIVSGCKYASLRENSFL